MSAKQKLKHITDRIVPAIDSIAANSLDAAESTPDGLGEWQGGIAALKSPTLGLKAKAQRTGDVKNTPGTDYPSKITHRQDKDFTEVHTDENGKQWLYNPKADVWNIPAGDYSDPTPAA